MFINHISLLFIPSNDMSIDRCKENIDTVASATDIFRKIFIIGNLICLLLQRFTIANISFVNVYVAIVIIIISWCFVPMSFLTVRNTVIHKIKDKHKNIVPENFVIKTSLSLFSVSFLHETTRQNLMMLKTI